MNQTYENLQCASFVRLQAVILGIPSKFLKVEYNILPLFQLAVTLVLIRRFLIQANICKAIRANSLTRLDRSSKTHYCSRNDIVSAMKHECNSTQFHTRNSVQQCSSDYGIM